MTWHGNWTSYIELCDAVPGILSSNEVPRVDWVDVTGYILCGRLYIYDMVNLFIFLGN